MANTGNGGSQSKHVSNDAGPCHLGNNDQLGISIVTAPFTRSNYLTWRTSIQISLGGKDKLGFIDGSIKKPDDDSAELPKWRKTDYMVRSWILVSLMKELAESFVYCSIVRIL